MDIETRTQQTKAEVTRIASNVGVVWVALAVVAVIALVGEGASLYEGLMLMMALVSGYALVNIMLLTYWFVGWWMQLHGTTPDDEDEA